MREELAVLGCARGAASLNFIDRETSGAWVSVRGFDPGTAVVADLAFADLDGDRRRDLQWHRCAVPYGSESIGTIGSETGMPGRAPGAGRWALGGR